MPDEPEIIEAENGKRLHYFEMGSFGDEQW